MSTLIRSSNRSSAQWASYIESGRRTSLDRFIAAAPHSPAVETEQVMAEHAIRPAMQDVDVFAHVSSADWDETPIAGPGTPDFTD